jgi:hypothetical protein
MTTEDLTTVRASLAGMPGDVSHDAIGAYAPVLDEIYAPETHAAALDPRTSIVLGARGTGKSFWAGVLGNPETRKGASDAYTNLDLTSVDVGFGFTGLGGPEGISKDALALLPEDASLEEAKNFWQATILRAAAHAVHPENREPLQAFLSRASDWTKREDLLNGHELALRQKAKTLLIVYDALDTIASTWPRRRLLTEALLEVVWAMRAYRAIRLKLFLRPDQIDDDGLRFVELPKLRAGAVRLEWLGTDLYGLLFSRLALARGDRSNDAFCRILDEKGIPRPDRTSVLARRWSLVHSPDQQREVMGVLAGLYMAGGAFGFKKGNTYLWPLAHLADAFNEVTPRSFLGLVIAAAKYGPAPADRVITADGIRHGLRNASRTRVDQLHQEFPWIKAVLAPLAGLLLPQSDDQVFEAWKRAKTVAGVQADASRFGYLPPFQPVSKSDEPLLFQALERIGVMFRRSDGRIDMPDLFRVAAKLLKKGGTAPLE